MDGCFKNRYFMFTCFFLLLAEQLNAQDITTYRSDTISTSVQIRYLFLTFGGGIEIPFKQHSLGLQFNRNYLPSEPNIHAGFDNITVIAAEYKWHTSSGNESSNHIYYGGHLFFKDNKHGSPEEAGWDDHWYRSNSINMGPLGGLKGYLNHTLYLELFYGPFFGWKWGAKRLDEYNELTNEFESYVHESSGFNYGFRFGFSLGLQL